jgi:hypothetical protein
MIEILGFIETPPPPTTAQWIDTSIEIMNISKDLGSKVYPLIMSIGLVRTIISTL